MNVAVSKTKAEQALTESFEAVASRLPGGRAVAEARKAAIGVFSALGLPHRRIEQWKYTDLRTALKEALPPAAGEQVKATAQEIDGALEPRRARCRARRLRRRRSIAPSFPPPMLSPASRCPRSVPRSPSRRRASGEVLSRATAPGQEAVIALNTAYMTDGAVVRIAEGAKLEKPLLLVFAVASRAGPPRHHAQHRQLGAGARATIIEAYRGAAGRGARPRSMPLTEIVVGEGAQLTHVKCTLAGERPATSPPGWRRSANAHYRGFQFTAATGLARNSVFALFEGEGAKLDLSGAFLARGAEHIDTTLVVDHAVPGCESRELFKGVLADHARGVFQGKVIVRPDAQKTDGKQMAQVLMLSPDAEFDSKPELEIFADDVVCGHGSTSAELDEDLLFYCLARHPAGRGARAADRELHRRGDREGRGRERARGPGGDGQVPPGGPVGRAGLTRRRTT